MELDRVTWIVAADGGQARIFEERERSGVLRERAELAMAIEGKDRPRAMGHRATVHSAASSARHGREDDPSREAESRFLGRLADALDQHKGDFGALVLIAPPVALGQLRAKLSPALAERVEASDDHDRLRCDADEMRRHLRHIRAEA
jgi:protein required for attachment to host cells